MVKLRSAKQRSSTKGQVDRIVLATKNTPLAANKPSRPSTRGEPQPSDGASFSAISSVPSDTASAISAAGSNARCSRRLVPSPRSSSIAPTAASTPGAMLMRNNQCHDQVWVIQPPTIGPTVGASTAATPATVVASPCERCGNIRNTAEKTVGIKVPPANPWMIRHATSVSKFWLWPHPADAMVNSVTAPTNNQRIPSRAVRNPVSGIATISAVR